MDEESRATIIGVIQTIGIVLGVLALPYIGVMTATLIGSILGLGLAETHIVSITIGLLVATVLLVWVIHDTVKNKSGRNRRDEEDDS